MGKKGENTRQLICNAAEQLFSKKGYTAVSMQMICDATGLSKGGLYRHFGNKADVLLELIKKEKRVISDIEAGKSATETLENLLKLYRDDMSNCKNSLALALFEYAASENEQLLDSKNTADKELWSRLVEYGVQTGEFNAVDPEVVMDVFLYAYRGVELWGHVLAFDEKTFDNITEAVRLILMKDRGITK